MTKNLRLRILHKITMALIEAKQGEATPDDVIKLRWDALFIFDLIREAYEFEGGAGAAWLDGKLKDREWVDSMHQNAIRMQRQIPEDMRITTSNGVKIN